MTLTSAQQVSMGSYFTSIKSSMDDLMRWYANNIGNATELIKFKSKNLNVYVTYLDNNFDFVQFFQDNIDSYESYFDASDCLNYALLHQYNKPSFYLIMTYLDWKTTPFLYSTKLYRNNSSPYVGVHFYDADSLKEVTIKNCTTNPVKLYFPVTNQYIPQIVNSHREIMEPAKQFPVTSTIFNDPIYIKDDGSVTNDTIDQRIEKYFIPVNFTCQFFNTDNSTYDLTGCSYTNYTDSNFYECKCDHLTDFIVNYVTINKTFNINSRFFYLAHYNLLGYPGNFFENVAFYMLTAAFGLYISIIMFYSFCDCYIYKKCGIIDYLKNQIIMVNLPYNRHYNFNLDIIIPMEALTRIYKGSRDPRQIMNFGKDENEIDRNIMTLDKNPNLELHLDDMKMKDIDVLILGDNLGGKKAYKDQELVVPSPREDDDDIFKLPEIEAHLEMGKKDADHQFELFEKENSNDGSSLPNLPQIKENDKKQYNNFINADAYKDPEVVVHNIKKGMADIEELDLEQLPPLAPKYTLETRLIEFGSLDLTATEFFKRNLSTRHIALVTFRISVIYGSYKRIGIFVCTLLFMMAFITIFFTMDETILLVRFILILDQSFYRYRNHREIHCLLYGISNRS